MAEDLARAIYDKAAGGCNTLYLVVENMDQDAELLQLDVHPSHLMIAEFRSGRAFRPVYHDDAIKLLWKWAAPYMHDTHFDEDQRMYVAHKHRLPQTTRALLAYIRKWDKSVHLPESTFERSASKESSYTLTLYSKAHCRLIRHARDIHWCIALQALHNTQGFKEFAIRRSHAGDRSSLRTQLDDMLATACTYAGSCDDGDGVPDDSSEWPEGPGEGW